MSNDSNMSSNQFTDNDIDHMRLECETKSQQTIMQLSCSTPTYIIKQDLEHIYTILDRLLSDHDLTTLNKLSENGLSRLAVKVGDAAEMLSKINDVLEDAIYEKSVK